MNKSYIEWIDYYENATKEDVIQDMMLDINNIKEKDKEIERLNNIIDTLLEINEKYEVEDTESLYSKKWLRETLEEFKGVINE